MAYTYKQGFFKPRNPQKYKGNPTNICYRSGLELKFMLYLDQHPDVSRWASEETFFVVGYRDPTTGRMRRYFPDFWFEKKNADGSTEQFLVEVKPFSQTSPPPRSKNGKLDKRHISSAITFAINQAKWNAAEEFCQKHNMRFTLITEKTLK